MIFKLLTLFALTFSLESVYAACVNRIQDATGQSTKSYAFCTNSLLAPKYQLSYYSSIGTRSEDFVMLFNFDPRDAAIVCNDFLINGKESSNCEGMSRDFGGKFKVKDQFVSGGVVTVMLDIENSGRFSILQDVIASKSMNFKTASKLSDVIDMGCFSGYDLNKRMVYLAYTNSAFHKLAYCVESMESYITRHRDDYLKLIR